MHTARDLCDLWHKTQKSPVTHIQIVKNCKTREHMSESEIPSSSPSSWEKVDVEATAVSTYIALAVILLGIVIVFCSLLICCLKCVGGFLYQACGVTELSRHPPHLCFGRENRHKGVVYRYVHHSLELVIRDEEEAAATDATEPIRLQGNDTYEDFTIPTLRALVLGLTQCALIIFYVDGMRTKIEQLHDEIEIA